MKRLLPLLLLAVLATGCRTTAMKGTPFYTGEFKGREGPVEDRVNLWPLAYYRAPALSVLWPIGEFSDDRFAIRPLFSMYRDGEGEPWHEYNWLGGLVSIDNKTHRHMAFPFFWGRYESRTYLRNHSSDAPSTYSYFNVFPLYWSGSESGVDEWHNALFPLWIYDRERNGETMLFCPWPLVARFTGPRENRFAVFPLWDHRRDPSDPAHYSDRLGLFLAGSIGRGDDRQSWIVPFYYARTGGPEGDEFVSLPWASKGDAWRAIPLLLSAWSPDGERGRVLLGLGGWEGPESWAFPIFYRDSATGELIAPLCYRNPRTGVLLSPLWASKDGAWRCIPPLLSWWNADGSGRALLGLAGWDDSRAWAFPLFYRDAANDTLVTPLWATQAGRWSAIPPLLSWRSADPATGESSLYLLGGLAGFEPDAHWFAPLYFRDEARDLFLSLPYAQGRDWRAIPPLLSWWRPDGGGRALLGLAGWDGDGGRHWLFPLYFRDAANDSFGSLLYAQGPGWGAIPPLLTWWNGEGGRALLGLGGWSADESWLLPFWYQNQRHFFTPLWGHYERSYFKTFYREGDKVETARIVTTNTYWATPLVGTRSGGETGSWLFPLWNYTRYPDEKWGLRYLLLGEERRERTGGHSSFFPIWERDWDDSVDALRAEMDAPRAPDREYFRTEPAGAWNDSAGTTSGTREATVPVFDYARDETGFLLGLGGTERRISLNGDVWTLAEKFGEAPHDGPLARFVDPNGIHVRPAAVKDGSGEDEFPSVFTPLSTNTVARYVAEDSDWLFPLWSYERTRGVMFDLDSGAKTLDAEHEDFSALLFLYDYKRESVPEESHEYARRRVLWRLYHYERLNGDESTDVFPAITYDRRKDGYRKFSFLWRFFRYERDPEKGTKLDVLFIPLRRP